VRAGWSVFWTNDITPDAGAPYGICTILRIDEATALETTMLSERIVDVTDRKSRRKIKGN